MKRKRSSSIEADGNSKKSSSSNIPIVSKPVGIPEQPQDILRKRLLGWVDPPATKESPKQERTTAPVDARRSQEPSTAPLRSQAGQDINQNYGQVFQIDLNQEEESIRNSPPRISPPPLNRPESG